MKVLNTIKSLRVAWLFWWIHAPKISAVNALKIGFEFEHDEIRQGDSLAVIVKDYWADCYAGDWQ